MKFKKKKKRIWNFHSAWTMSLSVCNQVLESVLSSHLNHSPVAMEMARKRRWVSFWGWGGRGGSKKSASQSGAGVYRGQLRWWEGGQRVQMVQQIPVQCCPTRVSVEVMRAWVGGQQLPVEHHGVEGQRRYQRRHRWLALQVLQAWMLLESILGAWGNQAARWVNASVEGCWVVWGVGRCWVSLGQMVVEVDRVGRLSWFKLLWVAAPDSTGRVNRCHHADLPLRDLLAVRFHQRPLRRTNGAAEGRITRCFGAWERLHWVWWALFGGRDGQRRNPTRLRVGLQTLGQDGIWRAAEGRLGEGGYPMRERFGDCVVSRFILRLSPLRMCLSPFAEVRSVSQTLLFQASTDEGLPFAIPGVVLSPLSIEEANHPLLAQTVLRLPVQTVEVRGGVAVARVGPRLGTRVIEQRLRGFVSVLLGVGSRQIGLPGWVELRLDAMARSAGVVFWKLSRIALLRQTSGCLLVRLAALGVLDDRRPEYGRHLWDAVWNTPLPLPHDLLIHLSLLSFPFVHRYDSKRWNSSGQRRLKRRWSERERIGLAHLGEELLFG